MILALFKLIETPVPEGLHIGVLIPKHVEMPVSWVARARASRIHIVRASSGWFGRNTDRNKLAGVEIQALHVFDVPDYNDMYQFMLTRLRVPQHLKHIVNKPIIHTYQ